MSQETMRSYDFLKSLRCLKQFSSPHLLNPRPFLLRLQLLPLPWYFVLRLLLFWV